MEILPAQVRAAANEGHPAGFTLLELIIVVFLIGLFLVVSVPALRDTLVSDPLRSSARKMIGYLSGVRDKAVREQQPYVIFIDLDENRLWYRLESDTLAGRDELPEKGLLQLPESVDLRDVWIRTTGTESRGVRELWLNRQGYLDRTIFHLENDDGEAISLVLSPFLPGVEVQDGYYELQE